MSALLEKANPRRSPPKPSAPLRVGYVMHAMQVAGAEVLVAELARRLSPAIQPTIICLDDVGKLGSQLQSEGADLVVLGRRPGIDWRLPSRLAQLAQDRGLQLLHAHQYTPFFYSALARMRGAAAKVIFTEHGRHYPDVVGWKRRWANKLLLRRYADITTACCRFAADAVEGNEGFGKGSVQVLPNGIDLQQFSATAAPQLAAREKIGFDPRLTYVTTVARFHPVKDHATLVRAFQSVVNAFPTARLVLVGEGPERSPVESLVHELGLSETVQFTGVRRDIADILSASDLFVLPSLSEAASLTLLEAMACGTPVVVTNVGGNPEIVREGIDGLLTPRGDAAAMADAILQLLADPERRRTMGQSARDRIAEQYDLADILQQYLALYRKVVEVVS